MSSIFASFVATIVTIPLIGYLIIFIICKQLLNNHQRSVFIAVDATTFLLVAAVHFLIKTIWDRPFLLIIFLIMFVIGFIYAIYYWRTRDEMEVPKILRGFWRVIFLVFSISYIILLLYGIIERIIT